MTTCIGLYSHKPLVMEQPAHTKSAGMKQFSLPIKTIESEEFSVGIVHPFRSHVARRNYPTIQPTIAHPNQVTGWGHSDRDFPIGSLKSGTDVITKPE